MNVLRINIYIYEWTKIYIYLISSLVCYSAMVYWLRRVCLPIFFCILFPLGDLRCRMFAGAHGLKATCYLWDQWEDSLLSYTGSPNLSAYKISWLFLLCMWNIVYYVYVVEKLEIKLNSINSNIYHQQVVRLTQGSIHRAWQATLPYVTNKVLASQYLGQEILRYMLWYSSEFGVCVLMHTKLSITCWRLH